MQLCSDGHDEVCFDQKNCPACELLKMNIDLEDKIYDLKEDIEKLNNEAA